MSLNNIDKDEVLEGIIGGSQYAQHDRRLFEDYWQRAQPL
jgi:hypothetical protein